MVEFNNSADLKEWLEGKPKEFSQTIAMRFVLQILPYVGAIFRAEDIEHQIKDHLLSSIFRACLISWVASTFPKYDIINAASAAADAASDAAADALPHALASATAGAAADAALAVVDAFADVPAYVAADASTNPVRAALSADATLLENNISAKELAGLPLWPAGEVPKQIEEEWQNLKNSLLAQGLNWKFWIDWYEDILAGRKPFGLLDDIAEKLFLEIATQENEWWGQDAALFNADIKKWLEGAREEARERESIDSEIIMEPEPQNAGAIRFEIKNGEPIGVYHSPEDVLLNDRGAIDRHAEVKRLASELVNSFDPDEIGANSVTQLIEETKNYQKSLSDEPQQANIDFLIPRGDGLRLMLAAQNNMDEFSNLPPVSDKYKLALEKLTGAHNAYVSLDPMLAMRDHALLGPDAKKNLISPEAGMEIVDDAVANDIAKPEVAEALGEETRVAPKIPDAEDRKSLRSSEGFKNFARTVVADVWGFAKKHKGKAAVGGIGIGVATTAVGSVTAIGLAPGVVVSVIAAYPLGKWMLKNENWFLKVCADEPSTLKIINKLLEILKNSPLN